MTRTTIMVIATILGTGFAGLCGYWFIRLFADPAPPTNQTLEAAFQQCCAELGPFIDAYQVLAAQTDKNKKVVLIDVREPEEQKVSMIPQAVRVQNFDLERASHEVLYVPYCTIGYRSGKFTQALKVKGFQAMNLKQGIYGWANADGVLREGFGKGAKTKKVHVYSKKWNFLRGDYTPVTESEH